MLRTVRLVLFVSLVNCVARTDWYGKVGYPPRAYNHPIDVFLPGEDVPRPFEVLGVTQVDGYYVTGTETLTEGAMEQARKHGGDAIVLGEAGHRFSSFTLVTPGRPASLSMSSSSQAAAVVASGRGWGAAGAAASSATTVHYQAPVPDRYETYSASWPFLSAIVLRYTVPKTPVSVQAADNKIADAEPWTPRASNDTYEQVRIRIAIETKCPGTMVTVDAPANSRPSDPFRVLTCGASYLCDPHEDGSVACSRREVGDGGR